MKKSLGAKTLIFPTPVWVVGTYDAEGKPNVMTAAWVGIVNSDPPSVAVSLRKATYTHDNIVRRKAFTISIPSEEYVSEADYFGIASGAREDKLAVSGLTPVASDLVDAPYVKEFPLVLECRLAHTIELGLHTHFVGEIVDVKADAEILRGQGYPDIERGKPIVFTPGTRTYHGIGRFLGEAFKIGKSVQERGSQSSSRGRVEK